MAYKLNVEGERLLEEMQIYSCKFCNLKVNCSLIRVTTIYALTTHVRNQEA